MKYIQCSIVTVGLASLLLIGAMTVPLVSQDRNQTPPPDPNQPQDQAPQQGVEVQARGELHEAFAQPSLARQRPSPIVRKQPPEPVNELPPDQKPEGDNVQWIPGYWAWDEDRSDFLWVSGTWRDVPPERRWVPGYWTQVEGGWRWVSSYWNDHQVTSVNIYSEPPEPIEEATPPPEPDRTYVPGTWVYRTSQWWWRPGFWITYRPGWCWVNAGYWWTPAGYVFIDGYWDYDLERRGICFAPVIIARDFYLRQGWFYRPSYCVSANFLFGSLFVNLGWNHYFFGDFCDPSYVRLGYQPWVTFATTARFDPLFSYYRWRHRDNPRWQQEIQTIYTARRDGSMARPPRTLAQMTRTGAAPAGKTSATATPLVALNQFKSTDIKLQRIPEAQMRELQTSTTHFRTLGQERSRLETRATRSSLSQPTPSERREAGERRDAGERRETTPPGREAIPPERGRDTGRRENVPPEKRETPPPEKRDTGRKQSPPEERRETIPPDTRREGERRESIPEQRRDTGREPMPTRQPEPPSRVELPKSQQTYHPPQADRTPPPRPQHPEPKQPERKPPEKPPGKPGG